MFRKVIFSIPRARTFPALIAYLPIPHTNWFSSCSVLPQHHTIRRGAREPRYGGTTIQPDTENIGLDDDKNYAAIREFLRIPGVRQEIFLVQPRVPIGPLKNLDRLDLNIEENKTLLATLGWKVTEVLPLNIASYDTTELFGSGNYEKLMNAVRASHATGLFVGVNMLRRRQLSALREAFHLPIYDRYRIVLEIFRAHAKTQEAKLQVALAELPYVRSCFLGVTPFGFDMTAPIAGKKQGETFRETQMNFIKERESKIRSKLDRVRENRSKNRENRLKNQIPSIAVVGYTNAGKTSLIRALTEDTTLVPEDKLFATLDVTSHSGILPNNIHALYMDTIGFISDIPTMLIASFAAVLEEVALADVVVHVRDISHPDTVQQKTTVLRQLEDLRLPQKLMDNIIEVCNKCDRLPKEEWQSEKVAAGSNALFVSATENVGIYQVREKVEKVLMQTSDLSQKVFRVPQSGEELRWLYREAHVHIVEADPANSEYLMVHCTVNPVVFAKFVHTFRKIQVRSKAYVPPVINFDKTENKAEL